MTHLRMVHPLQIMAPNDMDRIGQPLWSCQGVQGKIHFLWSCFCAGSLSLAFFFLYTFFLDIEFLCLIAPTVNWVWTHVPGPSQPHYYQGFTTLVKKYIQQLVLNIGKRNMLNIYSTITSAHTRNVSSFQDFLFCLFVQCYTKLPEQCYFSFLLLRFKKLPNPQDLKNLCRIFDFLLLERIEDCFAPILILYYLLLVFFSLCSCFGVKSQSFRTRKMCLFNC